MAKVMAFAAQVACLLFVTSSVGASGLASGPLKSVIALEKSLISLNAEVEAEASSEESSSEEQVSSSSDESSSKEQISGSSDEGSSEEQVPVVEETIGDLGDFTAVTIAMEHLETATSLTTITTSILSLIGVAGVASATTIIGIPFAVIGVGILAWGKFEEMQMDLKCELHEAVDSLKTVLAYVEGEKKFWKVMGETATEHDLQLSMSGNKITRVIDRVLDVKKGFVNVICVDFSQWMKTAKEDESEMCSAETAENKVAEFEAEAQSFKKELQEMKEKKEFKKMCSKILDYFTSAHQTGIDLVAPLLKGFKKISSNWRASDEIKQKMVRHETVNSILGLITSGPTLALDIASTANHVAKLKDLSNIANLGGGANDVAGGTYAVAEGVGKDAEFDSLKSTKEMLKNMGVDPDSEEGKKALEKKTKQVLELLSDDNDKAIAVKKKVTGMWLEKRLHSLAVSNSNKVGSHEKELKVAGNVTHAYHRSQYMYNGLGVVQFEFKGWQKTLVSGEPIHLMYVKCSDPTEGNCEKAKGRFDEYTPRLDKKPNPNGEVTLQHRLPSNDVSVTLLEEEHAIKLEVLSPECKDTLNWGYPIEQKKTKFHSESALCCFLQVAVLGGQHIDAAASDEEQLAKMVKLLSNSESDCSCN